MILAGGGSGGVERAFETTKEWMKVMNCIEQHELVASRRTDHVPAIEDEQAVAGVKSIAAFFNGSKENLNQ